MSTRYKILVISSNLKFIEKLKQQLEHASQGHEKWLKERTAANWAVNEIGATPELPTARQVFTRMFTFGGGRKPKPPK